jgi:hypothetical protein
MKQKRFYLSCLLIVAMLFLISACGDYTEDEPTTPVYGATVKDWTIKGNTMARNLANQWTGSENNGVKKAKIKLFLDNPDTRLLWPHKVVLFIGVNDLTGEADQDLAQVIIDYAMLFWSIKGDTYCVGIPEIPAGYDQPKIIEFNEGIESICGAAYYVDTWLMPFTSDDGVNPDEAMNALIKAKILEMEAAQP